MTKCVWIFMLIFLTDASYSSDMKMKGQNLPAGLKQKMDRNRQKTRSMGRKREKVKFPNHVPGVANLDIQGGGKSMRFSLKVPSQSIYGPESIDAKKTSKEQATKNQKTTDTFKSSLDKMVILEPQLGCTFHQIKHQPFVRLDHEHAETHSEFEARCKKKIKDSIVNFGFHSVFPGIVRIKVKGSIEKAPIDHLIVRNFGSFIAGGKPEY